MRPGTRGPPNVIRRDYRARHYAGLTDSRTGVELSLRGLADLKVGRVEGIEVDLLDLEAGVDCVIPGSSCPAMAASGWKRQ